MTSYLLVDEEFCFYFYNYNILNIVNKEPFLLFQQINQKIIDSLDNELDIKMVKK